MTVQRQAFTLQLTERCNLACTYCYVRRRRLPDPVDCTPEFCEQFVDFAYRESNGRVKITFFGGEPLLRPDLVRHAVAYAWQMDGGKLKGDIGFHLVTNGTLLDDATGDFIAREEIGLEISIDGPESVHDRCRVYPDGSPSFRKVYGNLLRFVERHPGHPVSIFAVADSPDSHPWLQALCRGIEANGFTFNPVRYAHGDTDHTGYPKALMHARKCRVALHEKSFLAGDVDCDEEISAQMACLLGAHETRRCEAGINTTIVTRTGDIYPCPFFVGHTDQVIGHIDQGFFPDKVQPYIQRYLSAMKSCKACGARQVCGSGCAFDSYEENGRVDIPAKSACKNTRAYARGLKSSMVMLASKAPEQLLNKMITPARSLTSNTEPKSRARSAESFVVRLTDRCNLTCDYCYDKGQRDCGKDMNESIARRVVRHILESPVADPLVCLFGGEPLLNWDIGEFLITEIKRGAKQAGKRPFFHVTTNGTLITPEIARTMRCHGITVQVSVDGSMQSHDRHRKYPDGRGSWAGMHRGVERLKQENPEAVMDAQVVLTPGNIDMVAIAGYLKEMGFRRISFLIAGWEQRTGISWTDQDITTLMKAREDFFPFFLASALRGKAEVDMGFASLVAAEPMGTQGICECGTGEVFIDTRARIHQCPQLYAAGLPPMGECGQPALVQGINGRGASRVKKECLTCWAHDRCGGGCMVRNQRCSRMPSQVPRQKEKLWCDFMRAEFARAILTHRILKSRRPRAIPEIKAMFGV